MADSNIVLNPGSGGDQADAELLSGGTKRERIQVTGATLVEVARVENTNPTRTDYGLITRDAGDAFVVSAANTTTTPLNATQTFTGTGELIQRYAEVIVNVAGQPELAQGTLYFEFSPDNTNWDVSVPNQINDLNVVIPIPLVSVLPYFRVRYVNGATNQTALRITTCLMYDAGPELGRTLAQVIGIADPVGVVRALVEPSVYGDQKVLGSDRSIYGSAIVNERLSRIALAFDTPLANNRVTSTTTNGGATAQASGQATMTTGASVSGTARLQSVRSVDYEPAREVYCVFGARFTTPTHANSDQRAGLFDDNNGFFLGYHGTTFGFTVRNNAADTFTALTAVNGDPLNATFNSRFGRGAVLEAVDPTKFNTWRIRYGWGSDLVVYEIQSPDGVWLRVHTVRIPNLQTTPSIQNPDQPFRAEAVKASADATSLVVGLTEVDAGNVASGSQSEPYDVRGREEVHAVATATGGATASTATVYTVNTGRRVRLCDLNISIGVKVNTGGAVQLTDGVGGTALWSAELPFAANTGAAFDHSYKAPPGFTTSIVLSMPAGLANTYSVTVDAYEEQAG